MAVGVGSAHRVVAKVAVAARSRSHPWPDLPRGRLRPALQELCHQGHGL